MTTSALQRLVQPFVLPPVFDFWAGKLNSTWSWQRCLARVVERHPESANAVTLWLKPNRHFTGFAPGQHVAVTAEVNGRRISRSYSLTQLPRRDGLISITVREVAGGALSPHLCRHTSVGDVVELGVTFGEFQIAAEKAVPRLFLAAGSGITPLMALTRQLAAAGMPGSLTLLYWARKRDELCFVHELQAVAKRFPQFRLQFFLTGEAAEFAHESVGRLSAEHLAAWLGDSAMQHVYACGPAGFVEAARALVADFVFSFQAEQFTPPALVVDEASSRVSVYLSASDRHVEVSTAESLLSALEAAGVQPEYGCRMGICNICACGKSEGSTQSLLTGERQHESTDALRICISRATSNLTLDL